MPSDVHDLRNTIIPRSDQLNSEQLLGGPMILTVSDVRVGGGEEQPVSIYYEADPGRPYKPCKTMRKVLILAWGPDGMEWVGKSMELYNDPSVKFGNEMVGGIRISRLTDIPKEIKVSLTATKGRKAMHEIGLLKLSSQLSAVLAAIAAAIGRESLQKARALAEALTNAHDIGIARTAYAKKVEELRTKGAAPARTPAPAPAPTGDTGGWGDGDIEFTEDQVAANIRAAATVDILGLAWDQIPNVKDEAARLRLTDLVELRDAELRVPA